MLNGIGVVFAIPYPKVYKDVMRWLSSLIEIDLPKALPLGCVLNVTFFASLVARTLIPLTTMLGLAVASRVLRDKGRLDLAEMCSTGWFYLLFLVYPGCTTAVFQAFICDELEDGTLMMRVDYSITCWQGEHVAIALYALFMAFVFPIGTPCLYTALLYANSASLERIKRAEVTAKAEDTVLSQCRESMLAESRESVIDGATNAEADALAKVARANLPPALQKLTAGKYLI